MRTAAFGNKLFRAERAAFLYSELSRENISSVMEECAGFVVTERAHIPYTAHSFYHFTALLKLVSPSNIMRRFFTYILNFPFFDPTSVSPTSEPVLTFAFLTQTPVQAA